jgi:hypothetical protein
MSGTVLIGASKEVVGASLGDERLTRRAVQIVERLAAAPAKSFPLQTASDGELEGLYRFVNNEQVEPERILEPHYTATAKRAADAGRVIVVHDTTVFSFGGETQREGLGRIKKGGQGFTAHTALVVGVQTGLPLGVIGLVPTIRTGRPQPYPKTQSKRHDRPREFERWEKLVELSSQRLNGTPAVHVMDREGDAYTVFCGLVSNGQDFVIRSKDNRALDVPWGDDTEPRLLHEAIERATYVMTRDVQLTTKRPDRLARLRKAQRRMMRLAKLHVTATRVAIRHPPFTAGKSRHGSLLPRSISVNVVHVQETSAPKGEPPVTWTLLTTLPVDTAEQVELVIDCYRRRWLIEEYFKALKTGCAYEKRQLESRHALLNALALFIPIAWRLLTLRYLAREAASEATTPAISKRQIEILRHRGKVPLSQDPSPQELLLAIAAEGGHIKNNGDPGWQVLGRGYEKLLYIELGFVLAKHAMTSDQS